MDTKNNKGMCSWCGCRRGGYGFGALLLIIGLFFLAQDLGWVSTDVSFWPIVLVAFGAYFLTKK